MLRGIQRRIVVVGFLLGVAVTLFFAPYKVVTRVSDASNAILSATGSDPSRAEYVHVMHLPLFANHSYKAIEARFDGTFPPTVTMVELDAGRTALYWAGILILTGVAALLAPSNVPQPAEPKTKKR